MGLIPEYPVCAGCRRGAKLARGLCSACYQRRQKAGTLPPLRRRPRERLTQAELVVEVLHCHGRRPTAELAAALGYRDPRSLARRLRRIAVDFEAA
jgi:predicted amidophosphoribosyltransferase